MTILPGRLQRWLPALLLAGIALVYFSLLPVSYSFDGTVFSHFLRYALIKNDLLQVVQVQHLLYFPVNFLIVRVLEALFQYRVLEFFHLQLFSLSFAVMTLALLERMLKKAGLALVPRLAGVAAVAFSHAFWLFALDAEVHMAGVFFVAAGISLLLFRGEGTRSLILAALCFALAAGFHLSNALAAATAFFCLLERRAPWRRLAQFFIAYFSFMLAMYGIFAACSGKPVLGIFYGMFFGADIYSGNPSAYAGPLSWAAVWASFSALKQALSAAPGIASWLAPAGVLALLAMAVRREEPSGRRTFVRAMAFWFLPFFLFFMFWDTGNIEFKIHALVPLLLIAAVSLDRLKPAGARALGAALVLCLLLTNFFFAMRPRADIARNINYQAAVAIARATPADAQVLITGNFLGYGYGKIYIPYFSLRQVLVLDWLLGKGRSLSGIEALLRKNAVSGRPLYALAEVFDAGPALNRLLQAHRLSADDYRRFLSGMRFVPVAPLPGGHRLYRLEFLQRTE
jgi:hypothetical protein